MIYWDVQVVAERSLDSSRVQLAMRLVCCSLGLLLCVTANLLRPHAPRSITYDDRSLLVDGERLLFMSGGVVSKFTHYIPFELIGLFAVLAALCSPPAVDVETSP